jgi:predicted nucleic-acid-binding Zn-ribbon protein
MNKMKENEVVCDCPNCGEFQEHTAISNEVSHWRVTGNLLDVFSSRMFIKVRCNVCKYEHYLQLLGPPLKRPLRI